MYTYEADIEQVEGDWLVTVRAFPGCFGGGKTIRKACENAAEALRLFIASAIDNGEKLPRSTFHNPPRVVLCVEVGADFVDSSRCMSTKDAAEYLGVTPGRVSQLIKSGGLDAAMVNGRRMVTIASVDARKENPPAPHRPKADA